MNIVMSAINKRNLLLSLLCRRRCCRQLFSSSPKDNFMLGAIRRRLTKEGGDGAVVFNVEK